MYELYFHLRMCDRIIHILSVPSLYLNTYHKECFVSDVSLEGMLNRKTRVWQTGKTHIVEILESVFSYTYSFLKQVRYGKGQVLVL